MGHDLPTESAVEARDAAEGDLHGLQDSFRPFVVHAIQVDRRVDVGAIVAVSASSRVGVAKVVKHFQLAAASRTGETDDAVQFFVFGRLLSLEFVKVDFESFEGHVGAQQVNRTAAEGSHIVEGLELIQFAQGAHHRVPVHVPAAGQLAQMEEHTIAPPVAHQSFDGLEHSALRAGLAGQQVDQRRQVAVDPDRRVILARR